MMPQQHYKLDANRKPVSCGHKEAMIWRAENESLCRVGLTQVGDVEVSTIFLPFDHGRGPDPLMFETAVFQEDGTVIELSRTSTWEQAEAMHNAIVMKRRAMRQ
jgi:hypothetical protein